MILGWLWGSRLKDRGSYISSFAAALAFYLIISFIPFLTVTVKILDYVFPQDLTLQFQAILGYALPSKSHYLIPAIIQSVKSSASQSFFTVGFIVAIWGSLRFMMTLTDAFHFIFDTKKTTLKQRIANSLRTLALLAVWMLTFSITAWLLFLVPLLEQWISGITFIKVNDAALSSFLRFTSLFVMLFLSLKFTYLLFHPHTAKRSLLFKVAILIAGVLILITFAFSKILPQFWASNAIHGTLGSLFILLFWAYATCFAILYGACIITRFASKS